jgi:uncharacterized DUF497 family protein
MIYNFSWDFKKARANILKHKVTFEDASSIFSDKNILSIFDIEHSQDEERWISLGQNYMGNLLVVIHTYNIRKDSNVDIRIISARKPTKKENQNYYNTIK